MLRLQHQRRPLIPRLPLASRACESAPNPRIQTLLLPPRLLRQQRPQHQPMSKSCLQKWKVSATGRCRFD